MAGSPLAQPLVQVLADALHLAGVHYDPGAGKAFQVLLGQGRQAGRGGGGPLQQLRQLRPELTGVGGRSMKDRGQGPAVAVGQRSRDQLVPLGLDLADQLGKDREGVRGADLPSRRSALDLRGEQTVAVLVDKVEVDHVDCGDRGRVGRPLDPAAVDPFLISCGQHRFERAQVLVLKPAGCHPAAVHPHHRTPTSSNAAQIKGG